jgi:hypothetical protein
MLTGHIPNLNFDTVSFDMRNLSETDEQADYPQILKR